ncbi:proteasome regulatory subunit C-terminal-domain-containing protein [Tribonema minus]|uniref:Proteasome regulatory subunit C-terminal-domain-containing protein n=1 Tax=Tribonema minus TaxID=303371 RepID=A0A835YND8_9STRA|nr:proteasome regulatory subunit C-terminal-domain-containing protein [Tribonema minus]
MEVDKVTAAATAAPVSAPAADDATPKAAAPITLADIKRNIGFIVRATESNQHRLTLRAIRNTTAIRTRVAPAVLKEAVMAYVPETHPARAQMLETLDALPAPAVEAAAEPPSEAASMEVEGEKEKDPAAPEGAETPEPAKEKWEEKLSLAAPEVETYVCMLVLAVVLRSGGETGALLPLANALLARVTSFNRRTLDHLASKVLFYCSLAHERAGRASDMRAPLLALHRTCCLRHDEIGQATALNLLLRQMLSQNLLDQAYKLASKTNFPETCSNNQFCRYLYYMGRIGALQLDYTDAHAKLTQCARKAPANTALAFRTAVQRLTVIVQLLLGEVPERAVFNAAGMRAALAPYLQLTQAVRLGDLVEFNAAVQQNKATFQADRTYTLIQRLAHNVVKAGLRKVNVAYSRIALADVRAKVRLDSDAGAEFICARAIRDGVIDASIEPVEKGAGGGAARCLRSREQGDLYATDEPQRAFHRRVAFCLDVHNGAVRAMRYPEDAYKRDLERAKRKGALEDKTEEELAKEIAEDMDEDGAL